MRKLLTLFSALVALALPVAVPVAGGLAATALSGCAAGSAKQTIEAIAVSVDISMKAFHRAAAQGQVAAADVEKVRLAFEDYRLALDTAVTLVDGDMRSFAPADLIRLSGNLTVLITRLTR